MNSERRTFNRIAFQSKAIFFSGEEVQPCDIIDLSLKGVLVSLSSTANILPNETYHIEIPLNESLDVIRMQLQLTHVNGNQIGFTCINIDLESITHLRRLVELNLGDSHLLERELEALCSESES